MTEHTFEKVPFTDYSGLHINDRVIVSQGSSFFGTGTMVSGIVQTIATIDASRFVSIKLTDKRDEYIKQATAGYTQGNPGNIMYRVSEDVLQGNTPFLWLLETVIASEQAQDDLKFVCTHLDPSIRNSQLNWR